MLAKHLRPLTGGKRTYQWVDVDGVPHKWRMYHIPLKGGGDGTGAQMRGPQKPNGNGKRKGNGKR
jgi:hypothetical protein